MKKLLAVILALATVLAFAACGNQGEKNPSADDKSSVGDVKNNDKEPQNEKEKKGSKEDTVKAVASALQGVWVAQEETMCTLYAFNGEKLSTYVITFGRGGEKLLDGSFTVEDEKLSYKFSGATGFSNYTYKDGVLAVTDGNGNEIKKLSSAELMALLTQEEAASNNNGVICLADVIAAYYVDSEENTSAAEKKSAAQAAIKAEGEAALATMRTNYDKVQKLTWYESKNQPIYTDICCYIYPYFGRMDDGYTWLRVKLDYTDAQTDAGWIFFNKVIFSVDGENTTKTFSRSELTRDNDTEVWEIADFEPSSSEVALLKKIAASDETIIRFQGDEYHYDHTVTSTEKSSIINVLTAYDYMKNYKEAE